MAVLNRLLICFDFIFYVIFSYYYNDGKTDKRNYPPIGQTYFIMVIFFVGFFLFLLSAFEKLYDFGTDSQDSKIHARIVAVIALVFTYFAFYYKKRYIKIYNKFKKKPFPNSKNGKRLGWLLYFIGLMSPIILSYIIFKIKY